MTLRVSTLGFPRIGLRRELKKALENFWAGKSTAADLQNSAADLRKTHWLLQKNLGVSHIPSNDFSLYDHVLDTSVMVGAVPEIYGWTGGNVPLETYFAMARGTKGGNELSCCGHAALGQGLPAQEMTKWLDTNYHYMVPELSAGQQFALSSTKAVDEFSEAKALGVHTRPVLLGPVTFLKLAKCTGGEFDTLTLLPQLLPIYAQVLGQLNEAGADWVQLDEPCLVLDGDEATRNALNTAYGYFAQNLPHLKIMLASYFDDLGDNLDTAVHLPVSGLHIDLVRGKSQLAQVLGAAPHNLVLSLGVVDGRNVWRTDLNAVLDILEPVTAARGADRVMVSSSCSLLHVPIDLETETGLDTDVRSWLAFAVQKIEELRVLAQALDNGRESVQSALDASAQAAQTRKTSFKIHNPAVQQRAADTCPDLTRRLSPFAERRRVQAKRLSLPKFPTTTIGSFPQTADVRQARSAFTKGTLSHADYNAFLRKETEATIRWQEEIGLDVLVHGEFERNDMVQYFGEQLAGYTFTKNAWVQSYGSRCVRPPIIFGDVSRPKAMTVEWATFAQSLSKKPVKGMLTGPITMLQWSFVRDDLPRNAVCRQIAFAIRDEVHDLEKAGISIIQIDEAAMREGLPLRRKHWKAYLDWAVEAFRITSSGAANDTQIHTHMCYSEFNDIISAIGALDADVISIETARSKMELLEAFSTYNYPNDIGPGVYDIHAPRCPSVQDMVDLLCKAEESIPAEHLWINPDCGLKTRSWEEVRPALINMVEAARYMRERPQVISA
jgi:5-methyltetrahydropteroyltriglutamate--homocysteine methyltransferase